MTAKNLQKKIFPLPKQVEVSDSTLKLDKVALKITADVHTAKQAAAVIEKKLAALGIAALLISVYLKAVDKKKHFGLEEPNIK